MNSKKPIMLLLVIVLLMNTITACGADEIKGGIESIGGLVSDAVSSTLSEEERYQIPEFRDAYFHEESAQQYDFGQVDFSMLETGSIAFKIEYDQKLKLQVGCGDTTYTYDLPGAGEEVVIPLNMGNGEYSFRVMESVGDNKYSLLWKDSEYVEIEEEFLPYLVPSQLVNYSEESKCVAKARDIAMSCKTDSDVVSEIYKFLTKNIKYDNQKASTVEKGYLPDPDSTLSSKKGICFDYASLAAAMMRSLGIPCKLITGYVDAEVYHAWNTFYIEGQGWITAEIKVTPGKWQRVDITFAASGTSAKDLLNDDKYTTRFSY